MQIVSLIISGLALLAATVCVILYLQEKKRSAKQKTAFLQLIEKVRLELLGEISGQGQQIDKWSGYIRDLQDGLVPDFEAAREAVAAVNNFNRGVSGILNYDPMKAEERRREAK